MQAHAASVKMTELDAQHLRCKTMIDWSQIDTVLLDMDGTLLDLHFDNFFWGQHLPAEYAKREGISFDQAMAQLEPEFTKTQGKIEWYCTDYWSEFTRFDIPALKRDVQARIGWRDNAQEFLIWLKAQQKHIVIATNAHRDVYQLKSEKLPLNDYVHQVISSHDYQSPKEAQFFWQSLKTELNFDPARTLLIDDSLAVLKSAQKYGIKWLLCIDKPDSQQAARSITEFASLKDFSEIMK
jgi:5'-nucleotidase